MLQPFGGHYGRLICLPIGGGVMVIAAVIKVPHVVWILTSRTLLIPTKSSRSFKVIFGITLGALISALRIRQLHWLCHTRFLFSTSVAAGEMYKKILDRGGCENRRSM